MPFPLRELDDDDADVLRRKMDAELPGHEGLGACRWEPLGAVLHVLAGNVFVGAAGSLVEGLLTRNVNILKMSSSEGVFLPILIDSLRECDEDGVISKSLAVVQFGQKQADVIEVFKRDVDGIVVWGGESAVRGWRDGLPARTRLIVFGPKLSAAVVTRQGLGTFVQQPTRPFTALLSRVDVSPGEQHVDAALPVVGAAASQPETARSVVVETAEASALL